MSTIEQKWEIAVMKVENRLDQLAEENTRLARQVTKLSEENERLKQTVRNYSGIVARGKERAIQAKDQLKKTERILNRTLNDVFRY